MCTRVLMPAVYEHDDLYPSIHDFSNATSEIYKPKGIGLAIFKCSISRLIHPKT